MLGRCSCLLLASLFVTSVPAFAADGVSADVVAESRVHFDRGVELYREGSLDAALAEFTRAFELTRDFRLLYNLGQVQAERHDYARAIGHLSEYLRQGSSELPRERRIEVDHQLTQMRQRVAELWVSADVPGADVWVGQHLAGQLPLSSAILVNAGPTTVRVVKSGYKPVVRELILAGGDRPRLELQLAAEMSAPVLVQDQGVDHTWLWVGVSTTTALAAGSVVFGVLASRANEELDDELNTYPSNPSQIDDARSTVRTNALISDALAGAALVSAGLTLYVLLSGDSEPSSVAPAARIAPSLTGIWLDGNF
jgi:tetratricopeptide (TPR) repeat protein